jgi:hypothetical protein
MVGSFGFHKMVGISTQDEHLLAMQEELCSMVLDSYLNITSIYKLYTSTSL